MPPENHLPVRDFTVPPPGLNKAPLELDLGITGRCNLSCRYCFYADSMQEKRDIPLAAWQRILAELGGLAVQRVCLSGGEVFLRDDLFSIIDAVIENRMRYSILTNGTLITKTMIRKFSEGKRRLRLDSIQVSIDGSRAEIHDRSRPPKSFDRAVRGLRLLVDAGFPATVRVTLNRYNIDDLDGIARLLIDEIGLAGFSTNEAGPMGTARCYGENIVLSHEQRRAAMKTLAELSERYGNRIGAAAGPLAMAEMVSEIDRLRNAGDTRKEGRGTLCSCGGVFSKMAILHDGTMVPCNMLPTLVMGVAGMHPIRDAWLHSPAINAVRYRYETPLTSVSTCTSCPYAGFCAGGCPALVMAQKGRLLGIDPLSCYRYLKGEVGYDDLL
jgi:SynChlorMet cassette radical SAM/SPASM protein ScmE